ncbi:MAG: outer membrane lipid asymmetry maintenance protein MlaD [Nitrospinota bacterium]
MKRFSTEAVVGLFVLIGIFCLIYLSVKLGNVEIIGSDRYTVYAKFDSVSGLREGAAIEIAGVEIGRVEHITLNEDMAKIAMKIDSGVALQEDVIASIKTRGLIGDKIIKISPGGSDRIIKPGEMIRETESAIDIEELLSKYIFGKV